LSKLGRWRLKQAAILGTKIEQIAGRIGQIEKRRINEA
jgi:hypothetical protein